MPVLQNKAPNMLYFIRMRFQSMIEHPKFGEIISPKHKVIDLKMTM